MHMQMSGMGGTGGDELLVRFAWPGTSWLHGFHLELVDSLGHPLPRRLLHHLGMVNFDRRELVYSFAERVMGVGQETADISLPKSIGLPLEAGQHIGLYIMWDNETGADIDGVYLRFSLQWLPSNLLPRPVTVLPFLVDANSVPGGANTYEVPPGGGSRVYDFTIPVSGHLLGLGGHMHDHGVEMRLEDAVTGKVLARVTTQHGPDGRVTGMSRQLFALTGQGIHLLAGHPYRMVAVYDNDTGAPLEGVMAMMAGLFAPDDYRRWPVLDRTDRDYVLDVAALPTQTPLAGSGGGHSRR